MKYAKTRGTTDDPIRRQNERHDQFCAYDGCHQLGELRRITKGGIAILYCATHYNMAFATFAEGHAHGA